MKFFSSQAALEKDLHDARHGATIVSALYPLRCNLSGAENVALLRQYHQHELRAKSLASAQALLDQCGYRPAAEKRDGDMNEEERFAVKVARAHVLGRPETIIDRPASMLPNTDYPPWIFALIARVSGWFEHVIVLDYEWNQPLYREVWPCAPSSSK